MRTRKINQKGFDYYLEINGKDIDAIADVWTGGEYIGKQSLLDACRQLHHQFRKEKVHG